MSPSRWSGASCAAWPSDRQCTFLQGSLSLWGHQFRTCSHCTTTNHSLLHSRLGICVSRSSDCLTDIYVAELLLSVRKHLPHLELAALHFTCSDLHLPPSWVLSYPDREQGTNIHLLYHKVVQLKYSLAPLGSPSDHVDLDHLVLIASFSAAEDCLTSPAIIPVYALGINYAASST